MVALALPVLVPSLKCRTGTLARLGRASGEGGTPDPLAGASCYYREKRLHPAQVYYAAKTAS
jgi:hypothetical protein